MFGQLGWCCRLESFGAKEQILQQPNTARIAEELMDSRLLDKGSCSGNRAGKTNGDLHIPLDFSVWSRDAGTPSPLSGYVDLNEEQKTEQMQKLQEMVKVFVKEVLRGVIVDVVLEDGSLVPCRFRMDNKLSAVCLQLRDTVHNFPLANIQEICSGTELEHIETTTPLDGLCTTFVMFNDQCVSFKFTDVMCRERFATSMQVLCLALD